MSSFGGTIHRDELLWLYRLPFDAALVSQSFPFSYDRAVLHEAAARSLGFKTGTRATSGLDWQKLPLPAVGFLLPTPETNPQLAPDSPSTDQSAVEATDTPPHTLLIILKIEGEQRLYFRIGSQAPETITTAEAAARLGSELILVGKESATADDEVILPGPCHVHHALQSHPALAQAVSGAAHRQPHRRRAGQQGFSPPLPEAVEKGDQKFAEEARSEATAKNKAKVEPGQRRSVADELECAA